MTRDFFDPTPEEENVVLIDSATLRRAERLIESCEQCNPDDAEIPFDWVLLSSPAPIPRVHVKAFCRLTDAEDLPKDRD
jgi:hypothetical protein